MGNVQPRHSKGTTKGGQWLPKPLAEQRSSNKLNLTPISLPKGTRKNFSKVMVSVMGENCLLRRRSQGWELPVHLRSKFVRSMVQGRPEPTPEECLDIATIVVGDMLNESVNNQDNRAISHMAKAAVKGAYDMAFYDTDNTTRRLPEALRLASQWTAAPDNEYIMLMIEAKLRGMQIGDMWQVYANERHPKSEGSLRQDIFHVFFEPFKNLYPISATEKFDMGNDGKIIERIMSMPSTVNPQNPDESIIEFIENFCQKSGDLHSHPYRHLACYLLLTTKKDSPMYSAAMRCLNSLVNHSTPANTNFTTDVLKSYIWDYKTFEEFHLPKDPPVGHELIELLLADDSEGEASIFVKNEYR